MFLKNALRSRIAHDELARIVKKSLEDRIQTLENADSCRRDNHHWSLKFDHIPAPYGLSGYFVDRTRPYIACQHCNVRYEKTTSPNPVMSEHAGKGLGSDPEQMA